MKIYNFFKGRRVLITGHTGFKGSWLTLWLSKMGAKVVGLSVDIPTNPSMFEILKLETICDSNFGDINDAKSLSTFVAEKDVDIVFHLAAQPLVRKSYKIPLETLKTNVIGTANVLEAVRDVGRPCSVVIITSDKCYDNPGSLWGYRECDPMGGSDVYSMSKGAAELVVDAWRKSFFSSSDSNIKVATARAGNVIGGGDWSEDRIFTDSINAISSKKPIKIRNPNATRPWQHVLEPISGYLWLCFAMTTNWNGQEFDSSWNFGPDVKDVRPVRDLVTQVITSWGSGHWNDVKSPNQLSEAMTLSLNCEKAKTLLSWKPVWGFEYSIDQAVKWYKTYHGTDNKCELLNEITNQQIEDYVSDAQILGLNWAE